MNFTPRPRIFCREERLIQPSILWYLALPMMTIGMMKQTGTKQIPPWDRPFRLTECEMPIRRLFKIQQRRTCLSSFVLTCGCPVLPGLFRSRYTIREMNPLIWIAFLGESATEDWTFLVQEISQLWCLYFHLGRKKKNIFFYRSSGSRRIPFQSG